VSSNQGEGQPTLGEFLRQEREKRGITIEQVASATKINVRLLHLLESDQYTELPAKPFIRGFVSSYGRFIGIDSKEILTQFGDFLEMRSVERPTRDAGHSGYAFEKREGEQSRTVLWIVVGAFMVFGAIGFVVLKPSLHHHHGSHLDKLKEANPEDSPVPSPLASMDVVATPSTTPSASPSSSPEPQSSPTQKPAQTVATPVAPVAPIAPVPPPTPEATKASPNKIENDKIEKPSTKTTPSPAPTPTALSSASVEKSERPDTLNSGVNLKASEIKYKVVIKAGQDLWVRFQLDSRPKMKFILREGRTLVLRAQDQVRFQTSQSDAVSIRVNGGAGAPLAGNPNAVQKDSGLTLILPKEAVETIGEPFPGEKSLEGIAVPAPRATNSSPTPTE
jgi:cytoskeleton protein RodZ